MKKNKNIMVIIVLSLFVLIFTGCGSAVKTSSPVIQETQTPPTSFPIINPTQAPVEFTALDDIGRFPQCDTVVSIGDDVFFKGPLETEDDKTSYGLYMININDKNSKKIIYNDFQCQINQYKEKLYFIDNESDLVLLDPKTGSSEIFIQSVWGAIIINDELYYSKMLDEYGNANLIAKNLNDNTENLVMENYEAKQFDIRKKADGEILISGIDGYHTWSKEAGLKNFDLSPYKYLGDIEQFFKDGSVLGFDPSGLSIYSQDGTSKEQVIVFDQRMNETFTSWFIIGNYIYYSISLETDSFPFFASEKTTLIYNCRYSFSDPSTYGTTKYYLETNRAMIYTNGNYIFEGMDAETRNVYVFNMLNNQQEEFD